MTPHDEQHEQHEQHPAIDAYLAALAARLTVEPTECATILEEIRGHLEEATASREARGATTAEAESRAVAAFGPARETARSLNAALPVYWDVRRMLLGIGQGVLAIWFIWTLATFPFVVQMAVAHRLDVDTSPASLLFMASPLGFGLFYALRDGPWAALLILALFGAVAFALGSRASSGWRAGLAFGLGVIVGMPFLPLSLVMPSSRFSILALVPIIIIIWLLTPYASFAAWLGALFARIRGSRRTRVAPVAAPRRRTLSRAALAGVVVLVALLGVNGWSVVRVLTPTPAPVVVAPSVAQQLAEAQASLPFTIRQPGYLPEGMTLTRVTPAYSNCNPCVDYTVALLEYSDSHDNWIRVGELPHSLALAPTTTEFAFSAGSITGYHQVWWLGAEERTEQQTTVTWNDGILDYDVSTNMQLPQPMLERIAASFSQ